MIALFAIAAMLAGSAGKPTANGDPIGTATSDRNGRVTLKLRSVECDGMIAESVLTVGPKDANYASTMKWLGGIKRGETKKIVAKNLDPCLEP
jgi:hypothetical protein